MADEPETAPVAHPDAEELAALRKEKADRETAAAAERETELTELRAFKKQADERKAASPKPPTPKADKPATPAEPAVAVKPRSHVSKAWFGQANE